MSDEELPVPGNDSEEAAESGGSSLTRAVAVAVLIPSVPLLCVALAALGLFYVKPERFDALLQRLPGTDFLRFTLIFAPATLFAIVVMAVLYAREKPAPAAVPKAPAPARRPRANVRGMAAVVLAGSLFSLLVSVALAVLMFVAPGRFAALTAGLPGQSYIRPVVELAPFVCLFVALIAFSYVAGGNRAPAGEAQRASPPRLARLTAGLVLLPAVPLLLLSSVGLGLFYAQPEWAGRILVHLGVQAFVRIGLIFAPATLLALVILAVLYLRQPSAQAPTQPILATRPEERAAAGRDVTVWLLAGGLGLSGVVVLGLLAALLYLLLR